MATREFLIEFDLRLKKLNSRLTNVQQRTSSAVTKIKNSLSSITAVVGGVAAAYKALDLSRQAKDIAKDGDEIRSKFNAVFKDMTDEARRWANDFASSVGRARQDVEKWMSTLQDTFVPLGFAREESARLSKELTQLAVDVASFNNESDAETIDAFTSAIVGNHEAVRKYGIVITETTLKQKALDEGYNKSFNQLTNLEKAQLRYKIIMESTTDAHGDAIRTADSLANREKRRDALLKDLSETIGQKLIPVFGLATDATIKFFQILTETDLDTTIRKLRELGLASKDIADLEAMNNIVKNQKEINDLSKKIKGEGGLFGFSGANDLESRLQRLKNSFSALANFNGFEAESKFNEKLRANIELLRDENVPLERKKSLLEATAESYKEHLKILGRLEGTSTTTDKQLKSQEFLVSRYEVEYESYMDIIMAIEKKNALIQENIKFQEILNSKVGAEAGTLPASGASNAPPKPGAPPSGFDLIAKDSMEKEKELLPEWYDSVVTFRMAAIDEETMKRIEANRLVFQAEFDASKQLHDERMSAAMQLNDAMFNALNPEGKSTLLSYLQQAINMGLRFSQIMNSINDSSDGSTNMMKGLAGLIPFVGSIVGLGSSLFGLKDGGGVSNRNGRLSYVNYNSMPKFSKGVRGIVPSKYPHDGLPIRVGAGEDLKVTPAGKVGEEAKLLSILISRVEALTATTAEKDYSVTVIPGEDDTRAKVIRNEKTKSRLDKQNFKVNDY